MEKGKAVKKTSTKNAPMRDPEPIVASIFLDLVLALKISSLVKKFNADHKGAGSPYDLRTVILSIFFSSSPQDAVHRQRLSEILSLQARRFAVYSFDNCAENLWLAYDKQQEDCQPHITCPGEETPPCCKTPPPTLRDIDVSFIDLLVGQALPTRSFFKTIVYWGEGVTIKGFDKAGEDVEGTTETIGIVDGDLIIKKIDFSSSFSDLMYIEISDPNVRISVPLD